MRYGRRGQLTGEEVGDCGCERFYLVLRRADSEVADDGRDDQDGGPGEQRVVGGCVLCDVPVDGTGPGGYDDQIGGRRGLRSTGRGRVARVLWLMLVMAMNEKVWVLEVDGRGQRDEAGDGKGTFSHGDPVDFPENRKCPLTKQKLQRVGKGKVCPFFGDLALFTYVESLGRARSQSPSDGVQIYLRSGDPPDIDSWQRASGMPRPKMPRIHCTSNIVQPIE